jgi:hypothetical protein
MGSKGGGVVSGIVKSAGNPLGVVGGFATGAFGDGGSADAAQNAALEQQRQSRAAYNETRGIVNPATTAGLLAFDRDIKNQEKNLSRQEQLISQLDPTIIEASQQALRLLRGESSSTLAPIQAQRDQQRQKLMNSLRQQLGPGAESSTAGIQALTRFDSETNQLMAAQQQNALGMLGNVGSQFNSQRPDMLREINGLSQFNQGKSNLSFQQAAALSNARQGLVQTAGAQYTGDLIRGQQNQAMQNQLLGGLITGGTAAATGGMSAAGSRPQASPYGTQQVGQSGPPLQFK